MGINIKLVRYYEKKAVQNAVLQKLFSMVKRIVAAKGLSAKIAITPILFTTTLININGKKSGSRNGLLKDTRLDNWSELVGEEFGKSSR